MVKSYDLKLVVCTIAGIAISGYGESDAIQFEWSSDLVEPTVSADGVYIYSRTNDRGLTATITVHQKSAAYPLLAGLLEGQHGDNLGIAPPVIVPYPFALVDPSNGDTITSLDTVFLNRPAPSKGKTIGEVQFRVHLPSPKVVYGPLNVVP